VSVFWDTVYICREGRRWTDLDTWSEAVDTIDRNAASSWWIAPVGHSRTRNLDIRQTHTRTTLCTLRDILCTLRPPKLHPFNFCNNFVKPVVLAPVYLTKFCIKYYIFCKYKSRAPAWVVFCTRSASTKSIVVAICQHVQTGLRWIGLRGTRNESGRGVLSWCCSL